MKLTTSVFTDPLCFTELEAEWLQLLPRAATNTIFQTPQFLKTWWETLGCQVVREKPGELHLVTFRDEGGGLQGIAPLFIHTTSQGKLELSFIGCVNVSDYLDVIVNKESSESVYQALLDHIRQQKQVQQLYWCSIPERSVTRSFLHNLSPQAQETIQDVSPYILLPECWEEYLTSLERKQRHEVKRKWRKLEGLPHEFEVVTEAGLAIAALEEFIQLHTSSSSAKKEFWNDEHLRFFRQLIPLMAQHGWLKLFFLKVENKRVASMLLFDYADEYELYNSGFDPSLYPQVGTGATLTAFTIKHAIENGKKKYDFLRGGEQYKYRLGGVKAEVFDIAVNV